MCVCVFFFLLEQKDCRFVGLPPVHTKFTVMMMMMIFCCETVLCIGYCKAKTDASIRLRWLCKCQTG